MFFFVACCLLEYFLMTSDKIFGQESQNSKFKKHCLDNFSMLLKNFFSMGIVFSEKAKFCFSPNWASSFAHLQTKNAIRRNSSLYFYHCLGPDISTRKTLVKIMHKKTQILSNMKVWFTNGTLYSRSKKIHNL